MHVIMFSDLETQGGAAIAASRLADALCRLGQRVTRLVAVADKKEHPWQTRPLVVSSLPARVGRRLLPARGREMWDNFLVGRQLDVTLGSLRPDVINVHNLHGAARWGWSADLLKVCVDRAPTVWTLHDMWSFTGRCAYSYDCRKFLSGCDATCPTPTEHPALPPAWISGAWEKRRRLLAADCCLTAVTPSRWLAREAEAGLWSGKEVCVIPNGLLLDTYEPLDRDLARKALGIETPGPVLLVAAWHLDERRKGGQFLVEALHRVSHRPLTVITLGSGHLPLEVSDIHVHHLGHVDHERTKALVYNAADVFVHPAPVDNLPNVVMEALACGTPVAAFPIGGVPEMVRPGQTGWLADDVSAGALASTLDKALDDLRTGVTFRDSCRDVVRAEFDVNVQAQRYLSLFRSQIGKTADS